MLCLLLTVVLYVTDPDTAVSIVVPTTHNPVGAASNVAGASTSSSTVTQQQQQQQQQQPIAVTLAPSLTHPKATTAGIVCL